MELSFNRNRPSTLLVGTWFWRGLEFRFFRETVRLHVGWASKPLIGDNGFLDILLHLGVVGLTIFVSVLLTMLVRAFNYAVSQKSLAAFTPLLIMIYALFANISFSLFAETEVFIWLLIVATLFMTTVGESL